jgi:hydrogenase maturation factor
MCLAIPGKIVEMVADQTALALDELKCPFDTVVTCV